MVGELYCLTMSRYYYHLFFAIFFVVQKGRKLNCNSIICQSHKSWVYHKWNENQFIYIFDCWLVLVDGWWQLMVVVLIRAPPDFLPLAGDSPLRNTIPSASSPPLRISFCVQHTANNALPDRREGPADGTLQGEGLCRHCRHCSWYLSGHSDTLYSERYC